MHRLLVSAVICLSAALHTMATAEQLMSPEVMRQLGLEQAWARPIPAPYGAKSIADQKLFVHQENPREYVEIVMVNPKGDSAPASGGPSDAAVDNSQNSGSAIGTESKPSDGGSEPKVLARIATDQLNAAGRPIGRQEAERLANNEIRRLKRRGIDAKTSVRTVPRIHLYSLSSDGSLECRDAETGQPIWLITLGDPRLPYMELGVGEKFVTVINSANLYQVDAATGEVINRLQIPGAPAYGATNAGDYVTVPMVGGGVQSYPLVDTTIDPSLARVEGAALTVPTKSPDSSRTAWSTDRGFIYVMEMLGTPSMLFRLKTDGIVSGRIAAATGDRFYFGSESGQVYGVRATRSGIVMWSTPLGEPFYNGPLVFDDEVMLRSTYGNLFALSLEDGHLMWPRPVPSVGELVGVLGGQLYATTLSGGLTVIDAKNGARVASFPNLRPADFITNTLTDRIYLVSQTGDVQCLRREGAELPTIIRQPDLNPVIEDEEGEPERKPEETPFGGGAMDPFGESATDPFGGGGADPFGGGGADPFGGGGGDAPMDPFGGGGAGDDPFGGNPFGN
jgi:outer membrane protein assembly factor BamB